MFFFCRFFRLLAVGLPVLVTLDVSGALALDSNEAKCRKSLAGGVSLLSSTLAREQAKCHEGRLRGTVSDATDCNDPAQLSEKARTKVSRAEAKILKFAQTRCAAKGIAAAFLTSAGYGEAGEEGRAAQTALVALADELGILLAGPNGQGVVSTPVDMCVQIVAPYPPPGRIGVASQSGNFVSSFLNMARPRGPFGSMPLTAYSMARSGVESSSCPRETDLSPPG